MDYDLRYLRSVARTYPTIAAASTEIINLQAIMNLPKGTEHFLTDIHGEYEQFQHVLKNGSGSVKRKIDEEFGNTLSSKDKKSLATLIYYPEQKLDVILANEDNLDDFYKITLHRLIKILRRVTSKYTSSKVRKAMPKEFAYIIEELIHEKTEVTDKEAYYNSIINTIIRIGRADAFIIALSQLIQRLVIDHLHIVGDIFDRGPGAHIIMDTLLDYHSVDIQWGNHDIVWMGAASGHRACIANVIRLSAKYGNLNVLEEGYGINLIPLARFAMEVYKNDPCDCFDITYAKDDYNENDLELDKRMHKAIAVIQFKLEGQIIKEHPDFLMDKRLLLDKMDLEEGTVTIGRKKYTLNDTNFPTINPEDTYALSEEEKVIMDRLHVAFMSCTKLQQHVRFLFAKGSLYKVYNGNLLFHGCIPLNEDGTFRKVNIGGKKFSGKGLYDILEYWARKGYFAKDDVEHREEKAFGQDIMWFIWSNENSPVYGKEKMATFERYFLKDKEAQSEKKDFYYQLIDKDEIVDKYVRIFTLTLHAHIS